MSVSFDNVTIVGVGLLGGSLGKALKARGMAKKIRGVGRRQSSLDTALEVGAIDEAFLDIRDAAAGAGLIVICSPAGHVIEALDALLPLRSPETIVTDVASTKSQICEHVRKTWPAPFRFVGSHPMAGSEKFGPEHATPGLFEGCMTMIQSGGSVDDAARDAVRELWRGVGARVVEMDPLLHDAIAARTSHIPHLFAACLAGLGAAGFDAHPDEIRALVGQGFKDATRIAASRAEIWRDICITNRDAIRQGLDAAIASLIHVREAIDCGDGSAVEAFFERGRTVRESLLQIPDKDLEP